MAERQPRERALDRLSPRRRRDPGRLRSLRPSEPRRRVPDRAPRGDGRRTAGGRLARRRHSGDRRRRRHGPARASRRRAITRRRHSRCDGQRDHGRSGKENRQRALLDEGMARAPDARVRRGAAMKIVFLEPSGKGAMIHYSFQLCRGLAANGADVTLITATDYELAALDAPFRVEPIIELWDPKPPGRVSTAPWAVAWRKLRRIGRALRYYREWLRQIRRVAELKPDVVMLGDIRFAFDLFP